MTPFGDEPTTDQRARPRRHGDVRRQAGRPRPLRVRARPAAATRLSVAAAPASLRPDASRPGDLQGLRHPRPPRRAARRRWRRADRPRVRAGARGPGRQGAGRPAHRPGPRHAPDGARARRALPRRHGGRGRARPRRRDGGHRDALLPRRLARARRRADVHRVAQPEGLHGRQARARAEPCRSAATRASTTSAAPSRAGSGRPKGGPARPRTSMSRPTSTRPPCASSTRPPSPR